MIKDLFILECNRRRSAEEIKCENCGKTFLRVIGRDNKYCSQKCSYQNKTKKASIEIECFNCKKKITRTFSKLKSSIHGIHFCSRKCKEFSQSLNGNCSEIRPSHYGEGSYIDYRSAVKEDFDKGCCVCKEKEYFKLCVHHIDGNHKNNKTENLEIVCHNCHSVRHMVNIRGRWEINLRKLTLRKIVEEFDRKKV